MNASVTSLLKEYSFNPSDVDRLIVSCFLQRKNLSPNSRFLKSLQISVGDKDYSVFLKFRDLIELDTLEDLIEAFEFVISPEDKIINGAVYTPQYIRTFITEKVLHEQQQGLENIRVADIACGCGGFLLTTAELIHENTGKKFSQIFKENIYGLDIAQYSINRSKIILSLLAFLNNEDDEFQFNLFVGNALNFDWDAEVVDYQDGFDAIVGNPPYVASRNIDDNSKEFLTQWSVTLTGHPDLYIPFFEIGFVLLKDGGILGYITVNTFFKSINGRALRKYFSEQKVDLTIIDFRGEQVFRKKSTYTCVCFLKKSISDSIRYFHTSSKELGTVWNRRFNILNYTELDDLSGWNLTSDTALVTINKIERFENKMFSKFSFSTGIATLKNAVYKFKNIKSDKSYYSLLSDNTVFKIEKNICREIINANKVTTEHEIGNLKEKIIFPYVFDKKTRKYEVIPEKILKRDFPMAYQYLLTKKDVLAERDKSAGNYPEWYAYGRNQGLHVQGIKLFLPHISKNPNFVISKDKYLMFCNGEAIVSDDEFELRVLKRILETNIFWFYVFQTSKPYSSDYYSLSKNYIKTFSIPPFSMEEKRFIVDEASEKKVLDFLLRKYNLTPDEIAL